MNEKDIQKYSRMSKEQHQAARNAGQGFAKWMESVNVNALVNQEGALSDHVLDSFGVGISESFRGTQVSQLQLIYLLSNYVAETMRLTLINAGNEPPREVRKRIPQEKMS